MTANTGEDADPLCLVFIPPLVMLLLNLERKKGAPLVQEEVIAIRDKAVCMTMRTSQANELERRRGYPDILAEDVWNEWQRARNQIGQS